jgi:protein-disulfide isomerase
MRTIAALALLGAALVAVAPARAATDDAPDLTHSGKVSASTDPALPPAYGPNPAKVVVVLLSDFQCPVCKRITAATHQIAEEWPGDVRVEFVQFPLAMHPHAEDAAVAALAAHRQGKFWEMHDVLFENQAVLDADSLARYAEQAGCDMTRWRKDYADPAVRKRVRDEAALGTALGANATPAFLINGKLSVGWGSWMAFRYQVEQEKAAADALVKKGTPVADVAAKRAKENLPDAKQFAAYKAGIIDPLAKAAGGKKK